MQVWNSEANLTFLTQFNNASGWTFQGASCIAASIYIPYDPSNIMQRLYLSLMKLTDYTAIIDTAQGTADISLAADKVLATCRGSGCDTKDNSWLRAIDLDPASLYVVVFGHDGTVTEVPWTTSSGFVVLQAAPEGE